MFYIPHAVHQTRGHLLRTISPRCHATVLQTRTAAAGAYTRYCSSYSPIPIKPFSFLMPTSTTHLPSLLAEWCSAGQLAQVCEEADDTQLAELAINSKVGQPGQPLQGG